MKRFLVRFVVPALLFAAGIYFLLLAPVGRTFLAYFMSALFLGMGVAAVQHAWSKPKDE